MVRKSYDLICDCFVSGIGWSSLSFTNCFIWIIKETKTGGHNIFILEVAIGVKLSMEGKERPQGGKDPPWATQLGRVQ